MDEALLLGFAVEALLRANHRGPGTLIAPRASGVPLVMLRCGGCWSPVLNLRPKPWP